MKTDKLTMTLLFDLYGELLTEKQRDCFDLHYNQDYSLSEIAQEMGTSRQGVHDAVTRAEAQLLRMEEVTHCLQNVQKNAGIAAELERLAERLRSPEPGDLTETAAAVTAAAQALKE